jgi:hypothetical protein
MQILKEKAHSDLKRAADKHWSDGALEVQDENLFLLLAGSYQYQLIIEI